MAKTYRPYVPERDLLLPPSLRVWLPEDHLAYFVSDLVDQLDLSATGNFMADAGARAHRITAATHGLIRPACRSVADE